MGLLDAYQGENEQAAQDLVQRPLAPRPQAAKFSAWNFTTALPRSVATAANEIAGSTADIVGAFGQTLAATDARSGMFLSQTEEQRQQEQQARDKLLTQGLEFDTGDQFRGVARTFMPDPQTASTAETALFGLGRFATKAVAYSAFGGSALGALGTGLDEGLTAADDLKQQGVDKATRTQVGAVAGLSAAAAVALPVAGKTVAQTAGLVAAGGPGSYAAQQAATRDILANAGYDQISMQYDPLDPLGLALSTIVPAGFGALALRGARARGKPSDVVAKPEVAGEVQAVQAEPETAGPAAPRASPEQVDAARVEMLTQNMERSGLYKPDDARAAAVHLDAFARALDDIGAGRKVEVTDLVSVERLELARALDTFAQGLETARTDLLSQAAGRADPGAIRQMNAELLDAQTQLDAAQDPVAIKARAAELQQSDRLSYKKALAQAKKEFGDQAADVQARVDRLESAIADNAGAQQAFDALNLLDRQAKQVSQQRAGVDAPAARETLTAAAARETVATTKGPSNDSTPQPGAAVDSGNAAGQRPDAGGGVGTGQLQPGPAAGRANDPGARPGDPAGPAAGGDAGGGAPVDPQVTAQRLAQVQEQFPDLQVQLDGMDKPVKLSEFLAQVQREALEGTDFDLGGNDAHLFQAAAECLLLNG